MTIANLRLPILWSQRDWFSEMLLATHLSRRGTIRRRPHQFSRTITEAPESSKPAAPADPGRVPAWFIVPTRAVQSARALPATARQRRDCARRSSRRRCSRSPRGWRRATTTGRAIKSNRSRQRASRQKMNARRRFCARFQRRRILRSFAGKMTPSAERWSRSTWCRKAPRIP